MDKISNIVHKVGEFCQYYHRKDKPVERLQFWQLSPQPGYGEYVFVGYEFLFWVVLAVAVLGVICSGLHFADLYREIDKALPAVRRGRNRYILYNTQRQWRLGGCLFMLSGWLTLFIGLANSAPSLISLWIAINSAVIFLNLVLLAVQMLFFDGTIAPKQVLFYVVLNILVRVIYNAMMDD